MGVKIKKILYNNKRKCKSEMPDLTPEEWVLAFVYAGNPTDPQSIKVGGKLLFVKEFFVFVKEVKPDLDKIFDFIPFDYGPYSFKLASTITQFVDELVLDIEVFQVRSGYRYDYSLTTKGIDLARNAYEKINPNIKSRLEKLRLDGDKAGYSGILHYVYSKYPEYTSASKIKEEIV